MILMIGSLIKKMMSLAGDIFTSFPTMILVLLCTGLLQFVLLEQILGWFKKMSDYPGNIGAIPDIWSQVQEHFDTQLSQTKDNLESHA